MSLAPFISGAQETECLLEEHGGSHQGGRWKK
jgi:hypothetical protein